VAARAQCFKSYLQLARMKLRETTKHTPHNNNRIADEAYPCCSDISICRAYINIFFVVLCLFVFGAGPVYAAPHGRSNNPAFYIPSKMRARMDFWIDVFTRYGKNQTLIHHRNYPHVIFKVLDFSGEARALSPVALERFKKKVIKREMADIKKACDHLAKGGKPRNELERAITLRMRGVPGSGVSKYKKVVREGLIRAQTGIREKYIEAVKRSGRYIGVMEEIFVKQHGLPIELTRLPFIESSFDYKAYSSAGAAGIWQFMRRTGRLYLTINSSVDERRDPIEATHAAAKYLKYAYAKLGTWPLALTSYNHGVYGVARKVKKMGSSNLTTLVEHPTKRVFGFASNNFYAEFLAALEVYDNLERYFPGLKPDPPKRFVGETLKFPLTIQHISRQLGLSLDVLKEYNYALSSRVWSGGYAVPKGYNFKIPSSHASLLVKLHTPDPKLRGGGTSTSPIYGGVNYRVRRGDTLLKVARRYNTSVKQLKRLNGLRSDLLRVGQVLVVKLAENSSSASSAPVGSGYYRVRSGDSLSRIARRYGTTVSRLKQLNNLRGDRVYIGQKLRVSSKTASSVSTSGTYRVKKGNTLSGIAKRLGTSVSALKSANGLRSDRLRVGQTLRIPGKGQTRRTSSASKPRTYSVRRGDNLWAIGRRLGVSVSSIKRANGLKSNKLYIGQKIRVP